MRSSTRCRVPAVTDTACTRSRGREGDRRESRPGFNRQATTARSNIRATTVREWSVSAGRTCRPLPHGRGSLTALRLPVRSRCWHRSGRPDERRSGPLQVNWCFKKTGEIRLCFRFRFQCFLNADLWCATCVGPETRRGAVGHVSGTEADPKTGNPTPVAVTDARDGLDVVSKKGRLLAVSEIKPR